MEGFKMKRIFAIVFAVVFSSINSADAKWSDLFFYELFEQCVQDCYAQEETPRRNFEPFSTEDNFNEARESYHEARSCEQRPYRSQSCEPRREEVRQERYVRNEINDRPSNSFDVDAGASSRYGSYINMHYSRKW